ncbi:hypothetical protein B0H14DRAFT_2601585 [Mycena olivaceomarginata]|nr:hypothetical protein B0H14DRAFT_2601585 [Mycena olivaceomarginata]
MHLDELHELPSAAVPLYSNGGSVVAFVAGPRAQQNPAAGVQRSAGASRPICSVSKMSGFIKMFRPICLVERPARTKTHRSHPYQRPVEPTQADQGAELRAQRTRNSMALPASQSSRLKGLAVSESALSSSNEINSDHMERDGWPDGDFSALFSMRYVEKNDNLHVHWATRPLGDEEARLMLSRGRMESSPDVNAKVFLSATMTNALSSPAPQTRATGLQKQLSGSCACGAQLVHQSCGVRSSLHTFSGGVYYQNGGTHTHSRPTVRLHLARKEREIFAAIVKEQPKVGPLPLVVGHATADGPAPSVANISPALVNAERVKYERRKVLVPGSGGYRGDNFVKEFAKFAKSNPNFIRTSHFGPSCGNDHANTLHGFTAHQICACTRPRRRGRTCL